MKAKILLSILALALMASAFGQKPTLELAFTAIDSAAYVQLDSIKVMNRTQGGDTVLYWPDTVLVLDYQVGMPENNQEEGKLQVFQNYPNPVVNQTTISLYVPEKDEVGIIITDILGREILKTDRVLEKGIHSFRFEPGSGTLFFFTAQWRGNSGSIKIINASPDVNRPSSIEYLGGDLSTPQFKTTEDIQSFSFSLGDELLYIGYANSLQSGMLDAPETSETYTVQFATNIPCPGTPTVTYEGQVYNTIQIFSQCWLKENLNVGTMINGIYDQSNNGTIEKYCYEDYIPECNEYGGLYQWDEMMQYTNISGTQGICPIGWHIPTDEEFKILEGSADSFYGIGDMVWDLENIGRGYDVALNLKSSIGWNGTDLFNFSALPGGFRDTYYGLFYGGSCFYWLSSEYDAIDSWHRVIPWNADIVDRSNDGLKGRGFSVRCVRDY
ncbi:MAG: hypothetical protein KAT48_11125 [Bacteroidales bacterium]|nr:hypothetical protein [Bacteroidales bacterium]